jgi:hypothetical protein
VPCGALQLVGRIGRWRSCALPIVGATKAMRFEYSTERIAAWMDSFQEEICDER